MWFPLESNPDVMNRYLVTLGIPEPKVHFVDVYGVTEDLLSMVPSPVRAVLLVYPLCCATEEHIAEQLKAQKEEVEAFREAHHLVFVRQYVPNACGTIAIGHALANNLENVGDIAPDGLLATVLSPAHNSSSDPKELGEAIAKSQDLAKAHSTAAHDGATANQDIDAPINLHFVCFIRVGGRCVELDGRKEEPLLHGVCDDDATFLKAAAAVIQQRMSLNPNSYEFGITALVDI